jgi:hypothetical protein
MPAPRSATNRLEAAQAAIAETNRKLAELSERRNAALLKDDDSTAIKLGAEIDALHQAARAHGDKVRLLREEAQREEQARRVKERAALIGRIEVKLDLRDRAMQDVVAAIKQLATASERAIKINREIVAAWNWHAHDLPPALLSPPAVMAAISHESYRLSYKARRYGGFDDRNPDAGLSLPGSRCPGFQNLEQPERIRPLLDVVRDASEFARQFMRTGKSSSTVEAVSVPVTNGQGEAPPRSEAEQRLGALLKKQAELAEDVTPQGEVEYQKIVSEIVRVQDEITTAKRTETQQHG